MTELSKQYVQQKAEFVVKYLFSNKLPLFNDGSSITTPLLGKVAGFADGLIMPTSGQYGFCSPRNYNEFITMKTEADQDKVYMDLIQSSIEFAGAISKTEYKSLVTEHLEDFSQQLIPACNIFNTICPSHMKTAKLAMSSQTSPNSFDGMDRIINHIYRTIQELIAPQEASFINNQLTQCSYLAAKHYFELCLNEVSDIKFGEKRRLKMQIEKLGQAVNKVNQEKSLVVNLQELNLL